jgi:hypothetical protein
VTFFNCVTSCRDPFKQAACFVVAATKHRSTFSHYFEQLLDEKKDETAGDEPFDVPVNFIDPASVTSYIALNFINSSQDWGPSDRSHYGSTVLLHVCES